MRPRLLAQTDVRLSPLALGTVKFGRNQSVKYPEGFQLPDDKQLLYLLDMAQSLGMTTLDTAPAYGLAESRLGRLLKNRRQQFTIISKAGEHFDNQRNQSQYDYSGKGLRLQLEQSLRQLHTDYLDVWLLHSDGNDLNNLSDEVLDVFMKAKTSGLTRAIGMSTKTQEGGAYALEVMDCIMMANSLENHNEQDLFAIAEDHGKSILLKKIYDSGWALTQTDKQAVMEQTLKQSFAHKSLCSAIIGTINPDHLQENIDIFNKVANDPLSIS